MVVVVVLRAGRSVGSRRGGNTEHGRGKLPGGQWKLSQSQQTADGDGERGRTGTSQ